MGRSELYCRAVAIENTVGIVVHYAPDNVLSGLPERDCHENAARVVCKHGGAVVPGWVRNAAHSFARHSVWCAPLGQLFEVTPRPGGVQSYERFVGHSAILRHFPDTPPFRATVDWTEIFEFTVPANARP